MKKILSAGPVWQNEGLGLIRIITGVFLVYHGWEVFDPVKMKEYTQWDFFKNTGMSSFLPYLGKGAEFLSGIMLTAGVFTRVACIILAGTMLYIAFFIGHGKIWYEDQHPFLFVLLSMVFFFTGPGKWSVDRPLSRKNKTHAN